MRRRDQLLRIGPLLIFHARPERIGRIAKHPGIRRERARAVATGAPPMRRSLAYHVHPPRNPLERALSMKLPQADILSSSRSPQPRQAELADFIGQTLDRPASEIARDNIETGREEETEHRHADHSEEHRDTKRLAHFRARTGVDHQWQCAK